MPRIALSIASLFLLTSSALIAANDNPFARWEKLQKQTDPDAKEAASSTTAPSSRNKKAQGGSLEYFAPNAEVKTGTQSAIRNDSSLPSTANVKRERLRSGSDAASSTTTETQVADKSPQKSATVTTAVFSGDASKKNIRQVNNNFFDGAAVTESATDATPNPFEEFLAADRSVNPAPALPQDVFGTPKPDLDSASSDFGADPDSVTSTFADTGGNQSDSLIDRSQQAALPAVFSGPQTPSVTLQWVHHGEFNLGQEVRCDLILENTGRTIVRNVVAEAVLPDGLQVVKADPAPTSVGGSATWSFGELRAGEKRRIELVVIPEQQGDTRVSAFVRITGASTSAFVVTQPALAVKLDGPNSVEVGQQVNYAVDVTNPGTGRARNVVIQAALPEGLEHRQGGLLSIEIGTLNPGEMRRARLSLTGVKGGDQRLAVRVVGDGGLQDQVLETVAVAEPRLNIGVRGPKSGRAGQVAEYELIVVNEGRVDSSNVRAKYKVPAGFEFVKADVGGKFNADDQTIDWFVGTLEPNQVRQFRVSLRPTVPGAANHQVGVISEHGRMSVAEHQTTVKGNAELSLKLVGDRRQVSPGDEVAFEVQVNNIGQSAAQNVGVSCEVPTGLELLDITAPTDYHADNGVVIFRSIPDLEAGKSVSVVLRARCRRAGNHRLRVRVASESVEEALIGEETAVAVEK